MTSIIRASAQAGKYEPFPAVNPGMEPLGSRVLVQFKQSYNVTKGGILLASETKDTNQINTQAAKVLALGALAFRNRDTREEWPEGAWCAVGDLVRLPQWAGDRFSVTIPNSNGDKALFGLVEDTQFIGRFTIDASDIELYV